MERGALTERELIARQIGRLPRGNFAVATRCPHGFPQVLRVPPIVDGAPFPTLYWLSCPFLCRAVGALEAEGWVARLQERLFVDGGLRVALERAHEAYIEERDSLAKTSGAREGHSGPSLLQSVGGIGGIVDRANLKCLHAHVAQALAGENPIGALVLEMLRDTACPGDKQICSSLA